jgi:hypothetical protein
MPLSGKMRNYAGKPSFQTAQARRGAAARAKKAAHQAPLRNTIHYPG